MTGAFWDTPAVATYRSHTAAVHEEVIEIPGSERVWRLRNRFGLQAVVRRRVSRRLRQGGMTVYDLMGATGFRSGRVTLALYDLEKAGVVEAIPIESRVQWHLR